MTHEVGVGVELEVTPRVSLALQQQGVPFLRSLRLRGAGTDLIDLTVTVSADPPFFTPLTWRLDALPAGAERLVPLDGLHLSPSFLAAQVEREAGFVEVVVRQADGVVASTRAPVEVLAPTQWTGVRVLPELLAAFVRPNASALAPLLKAASDRLAAATGDGALSGYQRRDPRHVQAMVTAAWEAVQAAGVSYINPPASFELGGQKIRTHEAVLGDRLGTCLDLSCLLAALFEQIGLHPLLVLVQGHAFVGVWLTEFELPEATLDDPLPLRKRVELGEALVVDSSPVTGPTPFHDAVRAAEAMLRDTDKFLLALDVTAARHAEAPVRPLPLDRTGAELAAVVETTSLARPTAGTPGPLPSDRFRDAATPAGPAPTRAASRLDRWQQRLLDLSLRNRLLNHRDGAKSIPVPRLDVAALEDALATGGALALVPRPASALAAEVPEAQREDALQTHARTTQRDQGRLIVDLSGTELATHALELHRLSRAAMEETGATVLYVALGFLKWFESPSSTQPRLAPLVLMPVQLVRPTSAGTAWTLRAVEEETRVNVTLLEKLHRDFGLDVTGLDTPPVDEKGIDVAAVLHGFRRAVLDQPRWEVVEQASVATFSFAKFLMWLDLSAKRTQLLENPVVRLLSDGKGEQAALGAPILSEREAPIARAPQDLLTVVDADPSQLRAVLAAEDGSSFVLQGPPGTGKSQTITNIVAQLVAGGKSVLFVSEKLAALEVVHTRLTRAGLGPFCLELHSDKATRSAVVRQLAAPFELAATRTADQWQSHARELAGARDVLDRHALRLAADTPFGVPLRAVVTELMGMADVVDVPLPDVRVTALPQVRELEALVARLELGLRDAEPLADHPFAGTAPRTWTPTWEEGVVTALTALTDSTTGAHTALLGAHEALRLPPLPATWDTLTQVDALARVVLSAPDGVTRALLEPSALATRLTTIDGWIARGRALKGTRDTLLTSWKPALFSLDLPSLHARFAKWAGAFFLFAFFALWGARRALASVVHGSLPANRVLVDTLATADGARAEAAALDGLGTQATAWLGDVWRGAETDWDQLTALVAWVRAFDAARRALVARYEDLTPLDRATALVTDQRSVLLPGSATVTALTVLGDAATRATEARKALSTTLAIAPATLPADLDASGAWATSRRAGRGRLRTWCHAVTVSQEARDAGLGPLVDAVLAGRLTRTDLPRALARSLRSRWWREALEADPELASFSGVRHADAVARFRALDTAALRHAQAELVRRLVVRVPDLHAPGEEMALVRRQLQLKQRHMAPRKLFAALPGVLKRIKPVALMSPQSVARFLDPSLEGYDVVVFDEASQIPPWDAIGAIARGRQAVIVGDSKQLPPTSFFDRAEDDEEGALDDESVEELESILDEATASNLPQLRLRWHYRSRHESLITFSNRHYYDNGLHTFPSADALAPGVGLELRQLPSGSYDRGASRTNRPEAEAVVTELEALLSLPSDRRPSVGVVTFSMAQQRLVEDLVDALRARRPELEACFVEGEHEHVFVKNLENVQGDERDVMLFSIGYGADKTGKLTMSFGPVNRRGGERRLNVAITRARSRLIVFSTLDPDQIDLNRTSAVGARHLRAFLRFARDGLRALDAEALPEALARFESPFEAQVHAALTAAGHTVHSQIGCSGYRVDLAVTDPERTGTYLLGIECDGAAYHSSRSARERDRLRQAVLENLGWRMVRVWSTDWWFDREAQVKRLLDAIEDARRNPRPAAAPAPKPATPVAASTTVERGTVAEQLASGPVAPEWPDHVRPWRELPEVPGGAKEDFYGLGARRSLAASLAKVIVSAGPVHREVAFRHVATAWGFRQLGKRITETLDAALAAVGPRVAVRGEFLWPADVDPNGWVTFRPSEDGLRTVDEVAPEELANAAAWALSRGVALSRDELIGETAKVFGWYRTAKNVVAYVDVGVAHLLATGRAVERGGRIGLR